LFTVSGSCCRQQRHSWPLHLPHVYSSHEQPVNRQPVQQILTKFWKTPPCLPCGMQRERVDAPTDTGVERGVVARRAGVVRV
jgi:hypothetical protein